MVYTTHNHVKKRSEIMEVFNEFLAKIENPIIRNQTIEVLTLVREKFPELKRELKWNQPMFTHHGTFIIGFSVAKNHLAVAPEKVVIDKFSNRIQEAGYKHTKQLIQMPWNKEINYPLLEEIIKYNIKDKEDITTFWRK